MSGMNIVILDRFGKEIGPVKGSKAWGSMLTSRADADFDEAVERGNVYWTANQSTVTTQAGLSATTPALSIAVKPGAKKEIRLWYVSATSLVAPGAAAALYGAVGGYSATALASVTNATVRNAKTGDSVLPDGIDCASIATLPAAPVAVTILGAQQTGAVTVAPQGLFVAHWYHGSLRLQAGFNFSIQTSTASTLFCSYAFEVVDLS